MLFEVRESLHDLLGVIAMEDSALASNRLSLTDGFLGFPGKHRIQVFRARPSEEGPGLYELSQGCASGCA